MTIEPANFVAAAQDAAQDAAKPRIPWGPPIDPSETNEAPPPREWLLTDVLPLGKAGLLAAEGGAGKTMALVQLALSVATGRPWLGLKVGTPGRVTLLLGEEDRPEFRRRLFSCVKALELSDEEKKAVRDRVMPVTLAGIPCSFLRKDGANPVETTEFSEVYEALAGDDHTTREPLRLLIVDPLSRFAGCEAETDNASATRFMQSIEALVKLTGATAIVAHHTNKAARAGDAVLSTASVRGASALTDGARWVATMRVEKPEQSGDGPASSAEYVTLEVTKSNYAPKGQPLVLRRGEGGALVPCDETERLAVLNSRTPDKATEARTKVRRTETAEKNANRKQNELDLKFAKVTLEAKEKQIASLEQQVTAWKSKLSQATSKKDKSACNQALKACQQQLEKARSEYVVIAATVSEAADFAITRTAPNLGSAPKLEVQGR